MVPSADMPDLNYRVDPSLVALVGMVGMITAACGPTGSNSGEGTGGTDSTDSTDSTSQSATGSTGDPTDPTAPTDPTDSTSPTTTLPEPECQSDAECAETYCGYCSEGVCQEGIGCDCGVAGVAVRVAGKWRCDPYYDYCDFDEDCGEGYVCEDDVCEPIPIDPFPACNPKPVDVSQWNLGHAPSAIILVDLDGDKDLDLAAAEPEVAQIELALNDGAGNFTVAGAFGVGLPTSELSLAAGDLDGDGDPDLAVVRRDTPGGLVLLFGQDAVFTPGPPMVTGDQPFAVFIADVNGDDALDVVSQSEGPPWVGVRLGDGNGGFAAEKSGSVPETLAGRVSIYDATDDGRADLLAALAVGSSVGVWAGEPAGTFGPPSLLDSELKGDVLSGRLDLLGGPDIVAIHSNGDSGAIDVWISPRAGTWVANPKHLDTTEPLIGGVLVDSSLYAATGADSVAIFPGDGMGNFTCEGGITVPGPSAPARLAVGNLDGVGQREIVTARADDIAITISRFQ